MPELDSDIRNPDINVRFSNVRVSINRTSGYRTSGSKRLCRTKPVPNRFGTSETSEILTVIWTFEIRTDGYNPDVRKPDMPKTGQIYVRFAKPDVRYSALHCIDTVNAEYRG